MTVVSEDEFCHVWQLCGLEKSFNFTESYFVNRDSCNQSISHAGAERIFKCINFVLTIRLGDVYLEEVQTQRDENTDPEKLSDGPIVAVSRLFTVLMNLK